MRKFEGYQKGVNLGGWLSQADEKTKEHYDTFIGKEDIKRIASWGCDHVRLPIDYIVIEGELVQGVRPQRIDRHAQHLWLYL